MPKNQTVGVSCQAHLGPTSASVMLPQGPQVGLDLEGPGCPCQMLLPLTEKAAGACAQATALAQPRMPTKLYIFLSLD